LGLFGEHYKEALKCPECAPSGVFKIMVNKKDIFGKFKRIDEPKGVQFL
jgi:hypothetical protein